MYKEKHADERVMIEKIDTQDTKMKSIGSRCACHINLNNTCVCVIVYE